MNFFSRHLIIVVIMSLAGIVNGQSISNLQQKKIKLNSDTIQLDTLFAIPGTIVLKNKASQIIDTSNYDLIGNRIILSENIFTNDSIIIEYRKTEFDFFRTYSHLDSATIKPEGTAVYIGLDFDPYQEDNSRSLIQSKGLDYDGSFSRGFSFGNNQSLVLNSAFNLQMAGDLGNGLEILAAISDANIPIQPEGNTQQLQEFDRVFIQLRKDKNSIIAGDYDLTRPNSYFVNYFKKLKGISLENETQFSETSRIKTRGTFAISRGKFARNFIVQQEGNQGPYKLQGNEGERFLIVLSNSEKIYIDGQLLTRGLEHDYVIDYDRAELTFTAKRIITKDTRIIAEFEYADQNYLRSLYTISSEFQLDKTKFFFNLYNEQDSKSATGELELSQLDIDILRSSGDNFELSSRSGIILATEGFDPDRIMYELVFEASINEDILVYSQDPDRANYFGVFSEVGFGQGSYIIDDVAGANGRVYKWVGPGQGSYEPIIQITPPEKKQILSLGVEHQLGKNGRILAETSLSNLDLNRFSPIDNEDNQGLGAYLRFEDKYQIGNQDNPWSLEPIFALEHVQEEFNPLNPYRDQEFIRDWNLNSNIKAQETILQVGTRINQRDFGQLQLLFKRLDQANNYDGNKLSTRYIYKQNGFDIDAKISYLSSTGTSETSAFFRPLIKMQKRFSKLSNWGIGASFEREKNQVRDLINEELLGTSFHFDRYGVFISSPENQKLNMTMGYFTRKDYGPIDNAFATITTANEVYFSGYWNASSNSALSWDFVTRSLDIDEPDQINETPNSTVLGKMDYKLKVFGGALSSVSSYLIGSGQEAKREFVFQEVQAGNGNYIWIDLDSNNVQSFNEFEESPFSDVANFIKVSIFNNEFIRTNFNQLSQSFRFEGRRLFSKKARKDWSKTQKFISRFSTLNQFKVDSKTMDDGENPGINPFQFDLSSPNLVSYTALINNVLFFNKGNPNYDIQVGQRNNRSRILQINGFETRELKEYFSRIRVNIKTKFDFVFEGDFGQRSLFSELFENRNFTLDQFSFNPQINYRANNDLRITFSYLFNEKQNTIGLMEKAVSNDLGFELTLQSTRKALFRAGMNFVKIDYNGEANTSLELAILEGLKNGNNTLWNLNYTRRMSNNVDLIFSYEGRKTGEARTVHVARAQVKATF